MLEATALYDLDILTPPHKQKASLWDKLDYCRTGAGKAELKYILLLKDHSLEQTLQRQQAIAFLASKNSLLQFPVTESEMFYLHHYLDTNYTIDNTQTKVMLAVKSYMKLIASRGEYLYILSAVKQVFLLVKRVKDVYENLCSSSAPLLLKDIFKTMELNLGKLQNSNVKTILDGEPNPLIVYEADRQLRLRRRQSLLDLLAAYAKLEALCSLAKAHNAMHLIFPEIGEGLTINDLGHPLVKDRIANNISLNNERLILVTGPNMAGKSTFLKSVGLAFVMAYAGIGICASYGRIPFFKQLLTSINVEDDIGNGYSYFYNEVQVVKSIALSLRDEPQTMIIADELFRGTNVKDAHDCTDVVIRGFINHRQGLFVIATHLVETVQQFRNDINCRLLCFEGKLEAEHISFDFQIKEGISATRLGSHIMRKEGIPAIFGL